MAENVYQRIVITAGISLFNAHNICRKWTDEQNIFTFTRTNPVPAGNRSEEEVTEKWKEICRHADPEQAFSKPENVSAEYSLLHALRKNGKLGNHPHVTLIHTDTLGGRAAVILLERILSHCFEATVILREVSDINMADRNMLRQSLGGFMETLAQALSGGEPKTTCFAPVGGFKVMTSLGYLAGAYMGFPTNYLHEDNQHLHEIPAVPIRIDREELRSMADLMKRLRKAGDVEWEKVDKNGRTQIEKHPWLFERMDNLAGLNAFGRFIMDRPENRSIFGTKIRVSKDCDKIFKDQNIASFVRQQTEELLKKMAHPEKNKGKLRHDTNFEGLKKSLYSLYKGARNGEMAFSAAYLYDPDKDILSLNRIWTEHDGYEREAEQGTGFFDDPGKVKWLDRSEWFYADV